MKRVGFLIVAALAGLPVVGQIQTKSDRLIAERLSVSEWNLQAFDLPDRVQPTVYVPIKLGGLDYQLKLWPHDNRAKDFKVLVQGADGQLREVVPPVPRTYQGTVLTADGEPVDGTVVACSIVNRQLRGMVWINFREDLPGPQIRYTITPLSDIDRSAAKPLHVVTDNFALKLLPYTCEEVQIEHDDGGDGVSMQATGNKICDIAFDADYEFYQLSGSSVPNVVYDIENTLQSVEMIYQRDCQISYEVPAIIVRTTVNDPYSTTVGATVLSQMRTEWNNNQALIRRDLAQLITGRDLDGTLIGISYIGVVCTLTDAYGVNELEYSPYFELRVALLAHEIGHGWNAVHCVENTDCHIMCAVIDSCDGVLGPNLRFGVGEKGLINPFRDSRTCLTTEPDTLSPPFTEAWPAAAIDQTRWTYFKNPFVVSNAVNEPSPLLSLRLRAASSLAYANDEIRSNYINMLGQSGSVISFWTEHVGVESGKKLYVEFWNQSQLRWDPVTTLTSNGTDQSDFVKTTVNMPTAGYSSRFRIRFVAGSTDTTDNWYVDDISISGVPLATVSGNVVLENLAISPAGLVATLQFRTPGTTNVFYSSNITLNANGDYSLGTVPPGTYDIALKFPTFLRKVVTNKTVSGTTTNVNFDLVCGDSDGNNVIDLKDMNPVFQNFLLPGQGDVNLSGLVDLLDLNLMFANFGMSGTN